MSKQQLYKAIGVVAEATNQTREQVEEKLMGKDDWTHFLVRQAAK